MGKKRELHIRRRPNEKEEEYRRRVRKIRKAERIRKQKQKQRLAMAASVFFIIVFVIVLVKFVGNRVTDNQVDTTHNIEETKRENITPKSVEETTTQPEKKAMEHPTKSENYKTIKDLRVPYAILMDVENNQIIAGKKYERKIYPASMTKVMTLIVAVENMPDLTEKYTFKNEDIDPLIYDDASRAGFEAGDSVTVKDMLYGLILPSGADGAVGLANLIAGSEEGFVKLMNEKCDELGLTETHFMNCTGLYHDEHYTTLTEQAMIMAYAMQNETCAEILGTYQYTTEPLQSNEEGILLTSTMYSRMYGDEVEGVEIIGGKTGYVQESKHTLVSCARKNGKLYVAVTAFGNSKWDGIYDNFTIYGNYLP